MSSSNVTKDISCSPPRRLLDNKFKTTTPSKLIKRMFCFWIIFIIIMFYLQFVKSFSLSSTTTIKPRNSDLLAYKMYDEDDDGNLMVPIFERAPNSDYLVLSRMQRHTRGHKRKRHQMMERRISDDEQHGDNPEQQQRQRRRRRRRNRSRQELSIIPRNISRQAFDSLRSSVVIPSLGKAIPSMMTKRKDETCKTIPFQQKITQPGCKSRWITNHYCYGNCNSFYIPSDSNASLPFTSCSYCTPRRYRWTMVRLKCPYFSTDDQPIQQDQNKDENNQISVFLSALSDDQPTQSNIGITNNEQRSPRLYNAYRFKKVQIVTKCRCQV